MTGRRDIRLGADIGGTFTDLALDVDGTLHSAKVLTDYAAPEEAIIEGMRVVAKEAGVHPNEIGLVIHGTTLATNAIIQRSGAKTAFITTEGFRDTIEMRTESRFAQYDLNIVLPPPLVPRERRFPVGGRIDAKGCELAPLDEAALEALAETIAAEGYGAVAIGFLHSYANPAHEQRARAILARRVDVPISISAEVAPQMREFERFNTVCANAFVQPQMGRYLTRLTGRLADAGATCPVFMIHSGGGLMSVETAVQFPVRLIESGPAGGAIFAADIARRFGLENVLSYDMGGTSAKTALIEHYQPQTGRTLEVARTARFAKGSGMPIAIPVIEMIEIGAGGGSLASVDAMGRITTGPQSAGSEPGPACYERGGERAAVTDADLVLGKLDPANFAGGKIALSTNAARSAIASDVGDPLGLSVEAAAFGVVEVVDETMANAARVNGVESGKDVAKCVMIAFGGAAPLHAARLCEKLNIERCLVPMGAGVGSAIGFLKAPFAYEALASAVMPIDAFDAQSLNAVLYTLKQSAEGFVRKGTDAPILREITAYMRYRGQGWEIPVALPDRRFGPDDGPLIESAFRTQYAVFFGRAIDGPAVEIVTLSVNAHDAPAEPNALTMLLDGHEVVAPLRREVFDAAAGGVVSAGIFARATLDPGACVHGPAILVEPETSTVVTTPFRAVIQHDGSILLRRKEGP